MIFYKHVHVSANWSTAAKHLFPRVISKHNTRLLNTRCAFFVGQCLSQMLCKYYHAVHTAATDSAAGNLCSVHAGLHVFSPSIPSQISQRGLKSPYAHKKTVSHRPISSPTPRLKVFHNSLLQFITRIEKHKPKSFYSVFFPCLASLYTVR